MFCLRIFESISEYCETYSNLIPLSFVLGFYISIIMQRWWDQYCSIPWPDPIAVFVSSHIHGQVIYEKRIDNLYSHCVVFCNFYLMCIISNMSVYFMLWYLYVQDERGRLMRRTIMRYVCLGLTMVFANISPRVKKRFPTLDHFVEAGTCLIILPYCCSSVFVACALR